MAAEKKAKGKPRGRPFKKGEAPKSPGRPPGSCYVSGTRKTMRGEYGPDKWREVLNAQHEKAKGGDTQAATWIRDTLLGKPRAMPADGLGIELGQGMSGLVDAARLVARAALSGDCDIEALSAALAQLRNAHDFEQLSRDMEQDGAE